MFAVPISNWNPTTLQPIAKITSMRIKKRIISMIPFSFPASAEEWQNISLSLTVIAFTIAFASAATNAALTWKVNRVKKEESRRKDEQLARDLAAKDLLIANAQKRAAEANAEAGTANEKASKANERAEKLENDNLTLRNDLNTAAGQVAKLQADASNARMAQQKVEIALAEQKERAAKAELALLELQEKIKPRRLTTRQRIVMVNLLSADDFKGEVEIQSQIGDAEAYQFAKDINDLLVGLKWDSQLNNRVMIVGTPPVGLILKVRDANNAPKAAIMLSKIIQDAGIQMVSQIDPRMLPEKIILLVGSKP